MQLKWYFCLAVRASLLIWPAAQVIIKVQLELLFVGIPE